MMKQDTDLLVAYNNLNLEEKRKELAEEITELMSVVQKLKADINEENSGETIQDLKVLYDIFLSEEDYMTGMYKNILNLKDELAIYLDKITDLYYGTEE